MRTLLEQIRFKGCKIAKSTLNPFRPHPYYAFNGDVYLLKGESCINQGDETDFVANVQDGNLRFIELL